MPFCNEGKSCAYWLVNETLWYETEKRPRHLIFSPRRDRDVWKLGLETVSRPRRRDRDYIPGWYRCQNIYCAFYRRLLFVDPVYTTMDILFSSGKRVFDE